MSSTRGPQPPVTSVYLPPRFQGSCFFCGGPGPLTDEHIVSETVRDQIPLASGVRRIWGPHVSREHENLYVVLKDAVCEACNGGWMSGLETGFVAILGRQLTDLTTTIDLTADQQELIARWAVKVALLLCAYDEATTHEMFIPIDDLRWLAEHTTPPDLARVWMGALETENRLAHYSFTMPLGHGTPRRGFAAIVTFSIGNLLFHVVARDPVLSEEERAAGPPLRPLDPPPNFYPGLIRIWPVEGTPTRRWPPTQVFQIADMNALSHCYYLVGPPVPVASQDPSNLSQEFAKVVTPGTEIPPLMEIVTTTTTDETGGVQEDVVIRRAPPPTPVMPPWLRRKGNRAARRAAERAAKRDGKHPPQQP